MEKNEPVGGVSVCELNPELNLYPLGTCGEQSRDSVKGACSDGARSKTV